MIEEFMWPGFCAWWPCCRGGRWTSSILGRNGSTVAWREGGRGRRSCCSSTVTLVMEPSSCARATPLSAIFLSPFGEWWGTWRWKLGDGGGPTVTVLRQSSLKGRPNEGTVLPKKRKRCTHFHLQAYICLFKKIWVNIYAALYLLRIWAPQCTAMLLHSLPVKITKNFGLWCDVVCDSASAGLVALFMKSQIKTTWHIYHFCPFLFFIFS